MAELDRVVVVGASLAGVHAAESVRQSGFDGELVVLSDEDHLPYDRPPLSKALLTGAVDPTAIALRDPSSYAHQEIELRRGVAATALDLPGRRVILADGDAVPFDGLVLATGSRPRTVPAIRERAGVHTLRTLDDALQLRAALGVGARLVIVGAGFIGAEVAASARSLGAEVMVVDPVSRPLEHAVGSAIGQLLLGVHDDHGVRWRLGVGAEGLVGRSGARGVLLSDGSVLDADAVLVGVGAVPVTDWLAGSGLVIEDGVVCDAYLRAGPPGVFVAGDIARYPVAGPAGATSRVEHWTNAMEQGATAGRNLMAGPEAAEPFTHVPYFWSEQYDLYVQVAGDLGGEVTVLVRDEATPTYLALHHRAGTLCGVSAVNQQRAFVRARRSVGRGDTLEAARSRLAPLLP